MNAQFQTSTIYLAIAAIALSFLLTGLATRYARRRGLVDHPGERHSHTETTPRGGGAGLVAALLLMTLVPGLVDAPPAWRYCFAPGVILIAVTGWWDDHASLSARLRFSIQLAVSFGVIAFGATSGWLHGWWLMVTGGVFLIWMTNLYNFMDGSNGMAGLQAVFGAAVLAWLFQSAGQPQFAVISLLIGACCLGFLPWNLGRARVFMGDVGSLALGFAFGSLLLYGVGSGAFSIPVALMVMAVFLTDSTLTLLARVLRGERWYNAHRQHLYQRLIMHGWSHGKVALFYQVINLFLVLPAIVVAANQPTRAWHIALVLAAICALGWYRLIRKIGVLAEAG